MCIEGKVEIISPPLEPDVTDWLSDLVNASEVARMENVIINCLGRVIIERGQDANSTPRSLSDYEDRSGLSG